MGNGTWFSLFLTKTKLVIFRKRLRSSNTLTSLVLQNFPIQIVNSYKFLGLTFDDKLSWIFHIKELEAKCLNKILILKYISHTRIGCNVSYSCNYTEASSALNSITGHPYTARRANLL